LDPFNVGRSPFNELTSLTEPQANFLLSRFERVRTVDDVTANRDLLKTVIINPIKNFGFYIHSIDHGWYQEQIQEGWWHQSWHDLA
jgi:hypothetical protein